VRGLCLANLTVADAGPLALIDAAAQAGFTSVNLWLTEPPSMAMFTLQRRSEAPLIGDAQRVAEVCARLRASDVRVQAASAGWLSADFDRARVPAVVDVAAQLGTRVLAVVGWDQERARLIEHLGLVSELAAQAGMLVGLEPMTYSAVATLSDAVAIVDALAATNLRLIIDALHLVRSGGTPAQVAALAPDQIISLQLCDGPAIAPPPDRLRYESVNDRLHPGNGAFPLDELLAAIPESATIEVEAPVLAEAGASIDQRARSSFEYASRFLEANPR
jgi:sugar phosphate isomerase/epimerase